MNVFEGCRRLVRASQIAIGAGTILIGGYYVVEAGEFSLRQDLEVVFGAIGWIVGVEVFARTVGWVVRGFKGIPPGKDISNSETKA